MMPPVGRPSPNENEQHVVRATLVFLEKRLAQRATVEWALRLKPSDHAKRRALMFLVDGPEGQRLAKPWSTAWQLIEESWSNEYVGVEPSLQAHRIQQRLRSEDLSGAVINRIVTLVAPRLQVEPLSDLRIRFQPPPKRPRRIEDLLSARLSSARSFDPTVLKLDQLTDVTFLVSLATALHAAVERGLDIARQITPHGYLGQQAFGLLHRVYYVPASELPPGQNEPDRLHVGIAPSVKLLHAVVARLAELDVSAARQFTRGWKRVDSPVHLRLWAAMARDARLATIDKVAHLLNAADDRVFWNIHVYPEVAELRARRFGELPVPVQARLLKRIRKLPPGNQWPKTTPAEARLDARQYWAVRELRRIEIAGVCLPPADKAWLDTQGVRYPELMQAISLDEGFLSSPRVVRRGAKVDPRYDGLVGVERLQALEAALATPGNWSEDPAQRAADWIRDADNVLDVLGDLEAAPNAGAAFPKVWDYFGSTHGQRRPSPGPDEPRGERNADAQRVLHLLAQLPEPALKQALTGSVDWLFSWRHQITQEPMFPGLWLRLWPLAVQATEIQDVVEADTALSTIVRSSNEHEQQELDTLNTAVGKLVETFLAACPNLSENTEPFADESLRGMRDVIIATAGRAGLIARHELIQIIGVFLWCRPPVDRGISAAASAGGDARSVDAVASRRTPRACIVGASAHWQCDGGARDGCAPGSRGPRNARAQPRPRRLVLAA